MARDLHYSAIVAGQKGVGKSTFLAQLVLKYPKTKKVLIIDVNGSPAYNTFAQIEAKQIKGFRSGIVRMLGTPSEETLLQLARDFRDGLVIFEDSTKYITGNVSPAIRTFLVDHRMYRCDLIFTFHSLKRIPPFFWEMISFVELFKTAENFATGNNRNRIPNYENMLAAFKAVNAHKDKRYHQTVETMI